MSVLRVKVGIPHLGDNPSRTTWRTVKSRPYDIELQCPLFGLTADIAEFIKSPTTAAFSVADSGTNEQLSCSDLTGFRA
jgi:hypothetical protein